MHAHALGTAEAQSSLNSAQLCVQFYEVARKEIAALILSDDHMNVLRCFALEEDSTFVYLGLERCSQSLADLMLAKPTMFNTGTQTDFAVQACPFECRAAGGTRPRSFLWLTWVPHAVQLRCTASQLSTSQAPACCDLRQARVDR